MTENQTKTGSVTENEERSSSIGVLVVITGASGAGKDVVMEGVLDHEIIKKFGIERVITCTDRQMRTNESPSAYHFINAEELDRMHKEGELAEDPVLTGTSRKATPKSEIRRLFSGTNLIWRIDPSLAAKISQGTYFDEYFPENADALKAHTLVICINAPKNVIVSRRKRREGNKYSPEEFKARDTQEAPHLDILLKEAVVVENLNKQLPKTVVTVAELIANHHEKIRNKKT